MPANPQLLYWDSCVFLSYIDAEKDRVDTLETILDEVHKSGGAKKIVTSTVSIVEVAFGAQEKIKGVLYPAIQQKIDALWNDASVLLFIEYHEGIAHIARNRMRDALPKGYTLTPLDAIHLASAQWLQVHELHTYDHGLRKYSSAIGRIVCDPYTSQPRLPGMQL